MTEKILIAALQGKKTERLPIWLMRQAGRYLPEYREVRAQARGFLGLVHDPDKACEVTMQPVRRFGMDGAILFSDILVVPHALGQEVEFVEGEGPRLSPVRRPEDFSRFSLERMDEKLERVYETLERIAVSLRRENHAGTALIGFAGAPWTLACYMTEGGSSNEFLHARKWAYQDAEGFGSLIDLLTEATIHYLLRQAQKGAEVLQIFDSWAGVLPPDQFMRWVCVPTRRIVSAIREHYPQIPVIGFPRGAGQNYLQYVQQTGVTAVSIDQQIPTRWAAGVLQSQLPVQGNLDPVSLLAGGDSIRLSAERILSDLAGGPYVFNLGHGIHKDTPPENVGQLVDLVQGWRL